MYPCKFTPYSALLHITHNHGRSDDLRNVFYAACVLHSPYIIQAHKGSVLQALVIQLRIKPTSNVTDRDVPDGLRVCLCVGGGGVCVCVRQIGGGQGTFN